MRPRERHTALLAVALLGSCQSAPRAPQGASAAPTLAALQGDYFRFDSAVLGRALHIHVSLPEGYSEAETSYPTVYLTDGDSLFPLLAPTQLFLTYDEPVPATILVGVAYGSFDPARGNMRGVDYRPPPRGGAVAYQRFLAEELIPEIERRYRSDAERRILVGQSLGAGFVLYSAFTQPDLFWARIASNPAFGRSRTVFFSAPAAATRTSLRLFVASGERDRPALRADALAWFEHVRTHKHLPWRLRTETIANGTHAATMGEVYRRGMVWLFARPGER
jgi:hypothetical protein